MRDESTKKEDSRSPSSKPSDTIEDLSEKQVSDKDAQSVKGGRGVTNPEVIK
jgi:hypothetical protein